MPALLRYFSDLIHFKTSKLNPIPLHGNPVLDNFVFKHAAVQTGRTFASAHSCGLRPRTMMIFCNLQIFASAHSCGLRLHRQKIPPVMLALCLSAFVRVATLGLNVNCRVTSFATAHSRGLRRCTTKRTLTQISLPQRIRAGCDSIPVQQTRQRVSLPQRIRAGCDYIRIVEHDWDILCLSAFARVATPFDERLRLRDGPLPQRIRAGCDQCANNLQQPDGALPQRIRAGCDQAFHPLRRAVLPLPQRIRAGCDATMITATNQFHLCHSAFARVATAGHQRTCGHGLFKVVNNGTRNEGISALAGMEHFASAHSRGLRLGLAVKLPCRYWLCLSAFARVATLRPFSAAHGGTIFATAHSRGLRRCDLFPRRTVGRSLPQRIRAGCDANA